MIVGRPDEVGQRLRAIAAGGINHAVMSYKFELAGVRALREVARSL